MKKIVLTGGGTAGHVIPNLALLPLLERDGFSAEYIGSEAGHREAPGRRAGPALPWHPLGKAPPLLRPQELHRSLPRGRGRLQGLVPARRHPARPSSSPRAASSPCRWSLAAAARGIPVVLHESDMTPGLANRLCLPFATKVCASFEETLRHLPAGKGVHTGTPIRAELTRGDGAGGWPSWDSPDDPARPAAAGRGRQPGIPGPQQGPAGRPAVAVRAVPGGPYLRQGRPGSGPRGPGGLPPIRIRRAPSCRTSSPPPTWCCRGPAPTPSSKSSPCRSRTCWCPLPLTASRGDQILNARAFAAGATAACCRRRRSGATACPGSWTRCWPGPRRSGKPCAESPERDGAEAVVARNRFAPLK